MKKLPKNYTDNQILKKEVLPTWAKPPFLHCKDTTLLIEMQMP